MSKLDDVKNLVFEQYPDYVFVGVTLAGEPIFAKNGSGIFLTIARNVAKVDLL